MKNDKYKSETNFLLITAGFLLLLVFLIETDNLYTIAPASVSYFIILFYRSFEVITFNEDH